jgi:hypothetical protein
LSHCIYKLTDAKSTTILKIQWNKLGKVCGSDPVAQAIRLPSKIPEAIPEEANKLIIELQRELHKLMDISREVLGVFVQVAFCVNVMHSFMWQSRYTNDVIVWKGSSVKQGSF